MASSSPPELLSSQALPLSQISDVGRPAKKRRLYRPARPLPYELRQHCVTFLEEELYLQAFSLLQNLLIAGVDSNDDEDGRLLPAYVPHAQVVALAATLVVHPSMTHRAPSTDHIQAADDALFYLHHLNALVGPSASNFTTTFQFAPSPSTRPERRRGRGHHENSPESDDDHGRLRLNLANAASIWNRAEDFWHVVGWAFNCSVRHPKRWSRWKLWLTFMLDILENDLDMKSVAYKAKSAQGDKIAADKIVAESMLARYLAVVGESRAGKRKVMRAILADGGKKSLAEFGQVWENETRERKPPRNSYVSKRKHLDVDEGDFGDYMDADEDDVDEDEGQESFAQSTSSARRSTRRRPRSTTPILDDSAAMDDSTFDNFGDTDSISLRQRFMSLLANICIHHEETFLDSEDLFDLYTEFLRPLPLPIFVHFILPSEPYLEPNSQASLSQTLLRTLISSEAPVYKAVTMTQKEFETHFLPYPANYSNHLENAKVSILVECLLRLLVRYLDLQITKSFVSNLEKGIRAREEKAKFGAKKKVGDKEAEEDMAVDVLKMSAVRMRMLVKTVDD